MSRNWERRLSTGWPSGKPVWTLLSLAIALLSVGVIGFVEIATMTPLERYYLGEYTRAGTASMSGVKTSRYRLLNVVEKRGQKRLAIERDLEPGGTANNDREIIPFTLSPAARSDGATGLVLEPLQPYDNAKLYGLLGQWIYQDETLGDLAWPMFRGSFIVLAALLFMAIPQDLRRRHERRNGRRLKGPELVTAATFNRRNKSDGIGFVNQESPTMRERLVRAYSKTVNIPRERESNHLLIMGDSGTGKSALIRQLLMQIEARGETAIVYDPALEYTPQFYNSARGDLVLNPLDERMPYWSPGEEVRHEAEALTIAASLFPDSHRENTFFIEGPRKVFAHLLTLKPTPEELTWWLCHEEEIDRRLRGTELAAMVYPSAAAQRAGVLASLNMVADSLKLLPPKSDNRATWTAGKWAKQRQGWLFLTSTPAFRKRLLPLTSLWLDLLVLRLMNQGLFHPDARPTWFVLDELASLQKLPQLHTAITENRKSNNPVVLGFQGRSQLEARYGHEAEAMFSQPATKIFLRTSEPRSAKWISETIGEIEIERLRESRSSQFPKLRKSRSWQMERQVEPLVMPSEISGLAALQGYLKSGNLVVRLSFPYIELPKVQAAFIEREMRPQQLREKSTPRTVVPPSSVPAYEQRPREMQPVAERAKTTAAHSNEQQPFFE